MSSLPMMRGDAPIDWAEFLGRPERPLDSASIASAVGGKSVLITGAGGSIGSGLAHVVVAGRPLRLILMDLSENALYESYRRLGGLSEESKTELIPLIGSVGHRRLLGRLFQQYRPEVILHTAAYKHVPLMEKNPFSAIRNNAIGTYRLVIAAAQAGVGNLLAVSTDKAVNPRSIMGASKRIAEQIVLAHATGGVRMNAVRLCNVLGSSGSVAPIFMEQAQRGMPLTVTHPEAERYFLTQGETEAAILRAAGSNVSGRLLVPDCGEAVSIVALARYIAGRGRSQEQAQIEIIGLRAGDKLREDLLGSDERIESELPGGMRVIISPVPTKAKIADSLARLESAVDNYQHEELLASVRDLVPNYRASEALSHDTDRQSGIETASRAQ